MSDGWVATQNGEYPRIAMFPVSAPGSVAWQPDPTSRLLHGIVTSRKYGHLVRCGRFPPTMAMVRIWPEAPLSTRGSPLTITVTWDISVFSMTSTAYPSRPRLIPLRRETKKSTLCACFSSVIMVGDPAWPPGTLLH